MHSFKETDWLSYYGIHACELLFAKRKEAIVRVYLEETHVKRFKTLLKWCAQHKKKYQIVQPDELIKLTDSIHHEGICIQALPHEVLDEHAFIQALPSMDKGLILFLNRVENPHNIGAIVRNCANFNTRYLIVDTPVKFSPACVRIAQGGCEVVQLVRTQDGKKTLKQLLTAGFSILSTSSHQKSLLHEHRFAPKTCLILGSEATGIDPDLLPLVSGELMIQSSGHVESLNVSHAAAILNYAYCCQHGL